MIITINFTMIPKVRVVYYFFSVKFKKSGELLELSGRIELL